MSAGKQAAFWLVPLGLLVLALYLFSGILLPFVAGLILAYLLDPLADRLERLRMSRLMATLTILLVFVLLLIVTLVVIAPVIANQLSSFVAKLPDLVQRLQQLVAEEGGPLLKRLGGENVLADIQQSMGEVVSQGAAWLVAFMKSLWSGGQAIVGVFSLLVVTPVVAFYLLVDWDRMLANVDRWVPPRNRETVRGLAGEMDTAISGFMRGQSLVCLFLGTFYAVGLSLVGLNFGVLIGLSSGLLSFIPYVGSLTGFVLSVGVALVQFWPDWHMLAATIGVFVAGQFIEGNILSPKLVGDSVGLHPVWIMFALLAFGTLFGFVGLLLAVPLAAVIGVLVRYALRRYLKSPFYVETVDILDPANPRAALPPAERRIIRPD